MEDSFRDSMLFRACNLDLPKTPSMNLGMIDCKRLEAKITGDSS